MLVFVGENMDSDRDTSLIMADAPVTPTEIADRELNVISAPGNPGSSSGRRVETMETSPGGNEKLGRNKISLVRISAPSPFIVTIGLSADLDAELGATSTFVSNVPVESVSNDGSLDDPE